MDILLPDIHMLMLSLPSSWDPATETIQSQTSWSVASGPGWGGATVVVVVDMLVTRVVMQLSRNSDNILIMESKVLVMQLLAEETKYSHTMMNRWSQYVLEVTYVLPRVHVRQRFYLIFTKHIIVQTQILTSLYF